MQDILTKDRCDGLNHMKTGLAIFDKDMKLVFANQTIRVYLPTLYDLLEKGLSFKEAIFAQSKAIYPDLDDSERAEKTHYIYKIIKGAGTLEVTTAEGLKLNSSYDKTPEGGYIITTTDVTDRVDNENRLSKLRHEADIANKAKTEFLSDMSHEIRTPLSGVFMSAQLLQQQLHISNQTELASLSDILVGSANHLSAIINDVLDLSKIEAGQIDITLVETSLAGMIRLLKKTQDHLAQETGVDLKFVIDPKMPSSLCFDALRVRQCVTNLVNNALKFTHKGSVTVAALFNPETYIVTVHVVDTGIGISPEEQSQVFNHFTQAKQNASKEHIGTGLGLAISRKFARLMGGDITLTSELGKGSAFTLTFATQPANFSVEHQTSIENQSLKVG